MKGKIIKKGSKKVNGKKTLKGTLICRKAKFNDDP